MHRLNFVRRIVLTFILFFSSQVLVEDKFQLWLHFKGQENIKLTTNHAHAFLVWESQNIVSTRIVEAKNLRIIDKNFLKLYKASSC